MNLEKNVFEISKEILNDNPHTVKLNYPAIEKLSKIMQEEGKLPFPMPDIEDDLKNVVIELVASSINYCYWYSSPNIRPGNSNSGLMYRLVQESFQNVHLIGVSKSIKTLIKKLSVIRIPLLEERKNHLLELVPDAIGFCSQIIKGDKKNHTKHFQKLIETFTKILEEK